MLPSTLDAFGHFDEFSFAWKVAKNSIPLKAAWDVIKNCPFDIRTNPNILAGVKHALLRILKPVDELVTYANVPYITAETVEHIFRGSNNGGVHHISALIADPDTYKIHSRIPTSNGCYKATIYKNGELMTPDKDFFPDTWSENQVINAIKEAYLDPTRIHRPDLSPNTYIGKTQNGLEVKMYIDLNTQRIISAFPHDGY